MRSPGRANLVLMAAVAGLGTLAWWSARPLPELPNVSLTGLSTERIGRVTIARPDGELPILLERHADGWFVVRPTHRYPADSLRLTEVLRLASTASHASYPVAGRPLDEFGLDAPRVRVRFDGIEVLLGHQEPITFRRYALVGERMHLVADAAYVHLQQPWYRFVDRSPIGTAGALVIDAGHWRLAYEGGSWRGSGSLPPVPANELAARWLALSATGVEPLVAPPAAAVMRLVLTRADGSEVTYSVDRDDERLRMWRSEGELVYLFPWAVAEQLGFAD